MKKVIVIVFLSVMFAVIPIRTARLEVDASEAYQQIDSSTGVVTAADVNLRTGPSKSFDIICKLKKNQKVTVMAKLGDWYAVYVGSSGTVGAISKGYVAINKEKVVTTSKPATNSKSTPKADKINTNAATTVVQKAVDITPEEKELFDLANRVRKEEGLNVLEIDYNLVKIARLKANDLKENNYFNHTSKYYGTPFDMMKKYNIKFVNAGENIAGNQSIEKAINTWVNSSGNNLLNKKFTHTGMGIVESPVYGKILVQMFIKK